MTFIEQVDLSPIAVDIPDHKITDNDLKLVGKEIMKAFTTIGFCNLVHHGIPADFMEKTLDLARRYYDLPVDEKMKNARMNPGTDFYGWTPNGNMKDFREMTTMLEFTDASKKVDHKEAYNINRECAVDKFPKALPEVRQNVFDITDYYNLLFRRILHALGFALNLEDPKALLRYVKKLGTMENDTALRYVYYPRVKPEDIKEGDMRCGEHSDSTMLTFLFWNKVSGLQVMHDGHYTDAPDVPEAILVNVGDTLMHLTGGVLVSTRHRVALNPEVADTDRYSVAYFAGSDSAEIAECLCGDKSKYKSGITCRELQYHVLERIYEK